MAERRVAIVRFLFCFVFCLILCCGSAVSAADGAELISTDRDCTLNLSYSDGVSGFSDVQVDLYKIADVSADCQFTLIPSFEASGLKLNEIRTDGEWNVIRSTLEAHILVGRIEADFTAKSDQNGDVSFQALTPGLYLVKDVHVMRNGNSYYFDSALISVPGKDADGHWVYEVTAVPKYNVVPPFEPDDWEPEKETKYKILKLWKGDAEQGDRPERIEAEIFRNGKSFGTVTLSEKNNWSYSWTGKADGVSWTVAERNIPEGYTMIVEERGTTFILTNTRIPDEPTPDEPTPDEPTPDDSTPEGSNPGGDNPGGGGANSEELTPAAPTEDTPKTGDTSNIMLYSILLYLSGSILILLGIVGKRKHYEE